jgi:hypothetical protein
MERATRIMRRNAVLVMLLALALVMFGGTALAGHITSNVKSYTGCLVPNDGVIIKVREGDAPKSACTGGQTEVHLSGGDITKISVTGALSGGGDNGEVTIGLKPEFTLPSGCTNGQVAKWNGTGWACAADNDTTYSAGTGLALSGTEFSIASDFRVKNTPDCSSGQFATGFDSAGNVQCAAPPSQAVPYHFDEQNNPLGEGIPDDGAFHVYASVSPPAGTYLVIARGTIQSDLNLDSGDVVQCTAVDDIFTTSDLTMDEVSDLPFALMAVTTVTAGQAIELRCRATEGADGLALGDGRVVAVKVG